MSAEVHLEHQKKANLRSGMSSAPPFVPRVPTVTLISHRELKDKHTAHRLQPGSLDPNLATSSHYRCSE
ncbi:protein CBFA2T3 isoform X1, partial [Lates japonicus]